MPKYSHRDKTEGSRREPRPPPDVPILDPAGPLMSEVVTEDPKILDWSSLMCNLGKQLDQSAPTQPYHMEGWYEMQIGIGHINGKVLVSYIRLIPASQAEPPPKEED